ncbi:MAG: FAD-dependent monooxygenase [Legionellaceae bacterium]|nr:FAD-dependent monooxygenase [Legionellaceae bacterium]
MDSDILVSGAGVVGLSAALAMAMRGIAVTIIDRADFALPGPENFQRVYAINAASQDLLRQIGVWPQLAMADCSPYQAMEVSDSRSSGRIAFNCRSLAMPELGHIIGEMTLKKALLQRLQQQHKVQYLPGGSIEQLQHQADGLTVFTHRGPLQTKLLMVAEGAQSSTRALLGVQQQHWSYHQQALIARVRCEKAHGQTARQWFLPTGPLAFLPLPDAHECSIVWSCSPAQALYLENLSEEAFAGELSAAFQQQLGETRLLSSRHCFPLHMRHVRQYCGKHWLLLGDSAHSIHPLAGLGLNLGLADVQALWAATTGASIPSARALSAWQRQRKSQVWQVILLLQALKTLFATPLPPLRGLRGLGLNAVDRCAPLKHFFMRQAIGR